MAGRKSTSDLQKVTIKEWPELQKRDPLLKEMRGWFTEVFGKLPPFYYRRLK